MPLPAAHAAGSVVVVRDEEWVVSATEPAGDGWKIRCVGRTELVRGTAATFFTSLDEIEALDPAQAVLVQDTSPAFAEAGCGWRRSVARPPCPCTSPA